MNPTMPHWLWSEAGDQQELPPPDTCLQAPIKHTCVPCSSSAQKPFSQPRSLKQNLSLSLPSATRARAEQVVDNTLPPQPYTQLLPRGSLAEQCRHRASLAGLSCLSLYGALPVSCTKSFNFRGVDREGTQLIYHIELIINFPLLNPSNNKYIFIPL